MALALLSAAALSYSPTSAVTAPKNAFDLLNGVSVLRATDGEAVALNSQWKSDERCALFLFRSFG